MYENGKIRPIKTIPGMRGGDIKESDGGDEFNYDVRNSINVTVYPQYSN
jgi:hypothetical protein